MKTRPCNPDMSVYKGIKWTLALDVCMLLSFFLTWMSSEKACWNKQFQNPVPPAHARLHQASVTSFQGKKLIFQMLQSEE